MCISDEKFKKKFEANSIILKKASLNIEKEIKVDLFKDSYIKLIYYMEKMNEQEYNAILESNLSNIREGKN